MRVPRGGICAHVVLLACATNLVGRAVGASLSTDQEQDPPEAACPVQYKTEPQTVRPGLKAPLLLGGVWGGCETGCQPRHDLWGQICQADPDALAVINVCEYWQRPELVNIAMRVSKGAVAHYSPCDFYQYLKGRTLWLIGDSHTKNLYNAMRCFLIDFFDHADGECAASSDIQLQSLLEQAALRGHIYNTPPRCLHLIGGGRVCLVHSPMGTNLVSNDQNVTATLQLLHSSFAEPFDIMVVSFGRWHSNNCAGVDADYTEALDQVGAYLHKQRLQFPYVFFQPSSHDHTVCTNGTFNDTMPFCLPAQEGGYDLGISDKLHNSAQEIITTKYGISLIDSHEASLSLHNGHVMARQTIAGRTDCLHYCRPGMPELDIWYMSSSFTSAGVPKLSSASSDQVRQCVRFPLHTFKPFGAWQTNNSTDVTNNVTTSSPAPTSSPSTGPPSAEHPTWQQRDASVGGAASTGIDSPVLSDTDLERPSAQIAVPQKEQEQVDRTAADHRPTKSSDELISSTRWVERKRRFILRRV